VNYIVWWNILGAIILVIGVWSLKKLNIIDKTGHDHLDEFHHLWAIFAAFTLTNGSHEFYRIIPIIIAFDDAFLNHLIQYIKKDLTWQSPLHRLWVWLVTHL